MMKKTKADWLPTRMQIQQFPKLVHILGAEKTVVVEGHQLHLQAAGNRWCKFCAIVTGSLMLGSDPHLNDANRHDSLRAARYNLEKSLGCFCRFRSSLTSAKERKSSSSRYVQILFCHCCILGMAWTMVIRLLPNSIMFDTNQRFKTNRNASLHINIVWHMFQYSEHNEWIMDFQWYMFHSISQSRIPPKKDAKIECIK